jgi:hypothetical protein
MIFTSHNEEHVGAQCLFWSLIQNIIHMHVKWVLCYNGMAYPQVADGGDSLQMWRVAVNVLKISSHGQLTRGGPPAWGLGVVLTAPHGKKQSVTKCYTGPQT